MRLFEEIFLWIVIAVTLTAPILVGLLTYWWTVEPVDRLRILHHLTNAFQGLKRRLRLWQG